MSGSATRMIAVSSAASGSGSASKMERDWPWTMRLALKVANGRSAQAAATVSAISTPSLSMAARQEGFCETTATGCAMSGGGTGLPRSAG